MSAGTITATPRVNVNLGDLGLDNLNLDGLTINPDLPIVGTNPPGQTTPKQLGTRLSALSSSDRTALRNRCRSVIGNPAAYDGNLMRALPDLAETRPERLTASSPGATSGPADAPFAGPFFVRRRGQ